MTETICQKELTSMAVASFASLKPYQTINSLNISDSNYYGPPHR